MSRDGGIGRHVRLRFVRAKACGGSSPLPCRLFLKKNKHCSIYLYIKKDVTCDIFFCCRCYLWFLSRSRISISKAWSTVGLVSLCCLSSFFLIVFIILIVVNITRAIIMKSTMFCVNNPQLIATASLIIVQVWSIISGLNIILYEDNQVSHNNSHIGGIIISATKELIIFQNATHTIIHIAISMTFHLIAKSLNSLTNDMFSREWLNIYKLRLYSIKSRSMVYILRKNWICIIYCYSRFYMFSSYLFSHEFKIFCYFSIFLILVYEFLS